MSKNIVQLAALLEKHMQQDYDVSTCEQDRAQFLHLMLQVLNEYGYTLSDIATDWANTFYDEAQILEAVNDEEEIIEGTDVPETQYATLDDLFGTGFTAWRNTNRRAQA